MSTPIEVYHYELPEALIAQEPMFPREQARLLLLDRKTGEIEDKHIFDLPDVFRSGDLLVFNNSKVFKARLEAVLRKRPYELFLLRCRESMLDSSRWEVLIKRARRFKLGEDFKIGDFSARLVSKFHDQTGSVEIVIDAPLANVLSYCDEHGHIPIPNYIHEEPEDLGEYQTSYAEKVGSVAAPTAGFHFTLALLKKLRENGVETEFVTLHVGLGTFQPVKTETLEEHPMHAEYVELSEKTVAAISRAKKEGRRVIAVGTTTVRTLEGVYKQLGCLESYSGDVNLFITPGFEFHIVDALVTNFHLPKSTLLALVSAFAGKEKIFAAYRKAVKEEYRFFSFGDAMFIF
ncbi:MAG: tRNA preQ1(34) S-adenosylmethionine ribosyltransferase-isomerase QueA [bacterium]|nr:tRNA preQ1(34) S-adenosylmethionine ribosyltransferase-isomerase QueA [bacterium]